MDGQLEGIYKQLGITSDHIFKYKLDRCKQPLLTDLEIVDIDHEGKPFVLLSSAAPPWKDMYKTAHSDGVFIEPFSGFRSYIYQKQLIARKLKQGKALEIIITETAIPGFSEHHTGRAVDLCARGQYHLGEEFEKSDEFKWLTSNANRFNFKLSYPRSNNKNIIYEPWHWCFQP